MVNISSFKCLIQVTYKNSKIAVKLNIEDPSPVQEIYFNIQGDHNLSQYKCWVFNSFCLI